MSHIRIDQRNGGLLQMIVRLANRIAEIISNILQPADPVINSFFPIQGFPGTLLEIKGAIFGPTRGDNQVRVGGQDAVVVQASTSRLTVLVGPKADSGTVEVIVGGRTV